MRARIALLLYWWRSAKPWPDVDTSCCAAICLSDGKEVVKADPGGSPTLLVADFDNNGSLDLLVGDGRIFLGGHSYGGRQATMLCAAEPNLVSGLLLLSYPLHPPRKPEQLRIQHLPNLRTPSLFVQGTRDPFGSIEEMTKVLQLVLAKTELMKVEGAGHDLGFKGKQRAVELPASILARFEILLRADG